MGVILGNITQASYAPPPVLSRRPPRILWAADEVRHETHSGNAEKVYGLK
jgi:hypothetical protein